MEGSVELAAEDREQLVKFVRSLRVLLRRFLWRSPALVSKDSAQLLQAAWEEIESEKRFEIMESEIANGEYDGSLVEHGLYRHQLAMKVGIYGFAAKAVREEEGRLFKFFKNRQGILKAALKAANVVLGSVADAIPGGAVIKEFKDGAEAALDQRLSLPKRLLASVRRPKVDKVVEEPPSPEISTA
jgi:hypothetical protein